VSNLLVWLVVEEWKRKRGGTVTRLKVQGEELLLVGEGLLVDLHHQCALQAEDGDVADVEWAIFVCLAFMVTCELLTQNV
jgi:hypothetical protein